MKTRHVQIQGANVAFGQDATSARMEELIRHKAEESLRASDLRVKLEQVREAKAGEMARLRLIPNANVAEQVDRKFNEQIAGLEHEHTAAMLDFEATQSRIASLEKSNDVAQAFHMVPPPEPVFGPDQVATFGAGAFLLFLPVAIAMARRIWLRSGPAKQPVLDLESSPRMQRMEQAIESIAIEVERIGEAQRFAARLLSERRPDEIVSRVPLAAPQRAPGTITPH